MHFAIFSHSKQWKEEKFTKSQFKEEIKELLPIIEEVIRCLQFSPEGSFEHHLLLLAKKALINTKVTSTFIDMM